jgi:dTDP-4-amino-4,6-dideoxygalactose transaminase
MPRDSTKGKSDTPQRTVALSQPAVGEAEWQALREPLESGWLTQGPKVAAFEDAFAARHGVAHAVAATSGTTALHLALAALGIGPGDEVIVPAFTWVATANAVLYVGATPVVVDVDPYTYNLDVNAVRAAITEQTRAVIAVHLFGLCADTAALRDVVPERVAIVEDAACAAGADLRGEPAGSLGAVGCFSFHPRKSITTGEGGMVTTDDGQLADRMRSLRNHGAVTQTFASAGPATMPDIPDLGFNYRMTDMQAAVGLVQLEKLDGFIDERDRWARWYVDQLADIEWLATPTVSNGCRHAWQAFVTVVDPLATPVNRDALMEWLATRGIATRPGTHALSELSYYRDKVGVDPARYPVATRLHHQSMAIPLHNRMCEADYLYVVENLQAV